MERKYLEHWKPVVGYENEYQVSNLGRVKSHTWKFWTRRGTQRKLVFVTRKGRMMSLALTAGYPSLGLRGKRVYVHILVLKAFIGPCPKGMEARHLDDNKQNNNLRNLCWGTSRQNKEDMYRNGRRSSGEHRPGAKLTWKRVDELRAEYKKGEISMMRIAKREGLSCATVRMMLRFITWKESNRKWDL